MMDVSGVLISCETFVISSVSYTHLSQGHSVQDDVADELEHHTPAANGGYEQERRQQDIQRNGGGVLLFKNAQGAEEKPAGHHVISSDANDPGKDVGDRFELR